MDPRTRRLQRGSDVERDARRKPPARVLSAPAPTQLYLECYCARRRAPALPPGENKDFGMSPIYGQLSDKPLLAFVRIWGAGRNAQ